jgi:hypothetical protein
MLLLLFKTLMFFLSLTTCLTLVKKYILKRNFNLKKHKNLNLYKIGFGEHFQIGFGQRPIAGSKSYFQNLKPVGQVPISQTKNQN